MRKHIPTIALALLLVMPIPASAVYLDSFLIPSFPRPSALDN